VKVRQRVAFNTAAHEIPPVVALYCSYTGTVARRTWRAIGGKLAELKTPLCPAYDLDQACTEIEADPIKLALTQSV
jgi:hypothetical protein